MRQDHGLRTLRDKMTFTARPKIQSQSQIFRYCRSIFCLPHRPNFSDIFDLCLHWVSVVRGETQCYISASAGQYCPKMRPTSNLYESNPEIDTFPCFGRMTTVECGESTWLEPVPSIICRSLPKIQSKRVQDSLRPYF